VAKPRDVTENVNSVNGVLKGEIQNNRAGLEKHGLAEVYLTNHLVISHTVKCVISVWLVHVEGRAETLRNKGTKGGTTRPSKKERGGRERMGGKEGA